MLERSDNNVDQQYSPLGTKIVSGIIAFLPVLLFQLSLIIFKLKGIDAAAAVNQIGNESNIFHLLVS
ncbi:hypothetical protein [Lysinibacillus fusiformis]|uniref:hypothetical protein n=1 Tax=Lysinibacillus fusiformis TaxID=28031 RepID=UPI003829E05B